MKSIEQILLRAISLLCFVDRCWLEQNTITEIYHPLEDRIEQKQLIYNWLENEAYIDALSDFERNIFNKNITNIPNMEIYKNVNQYEAIQPLLWAIGLVDNLSNYNNFVVDDYHDSVQIGIDHNFEAIKSRCVLRTEQEINNAKLIAAIWYWRVWECNYYTSEDRIFDKLRDYYGLSFAEKIKQTGVVNARTRDLKVKNKYILNLNSLEINKLKEISKWRLHAFLWLTGDDEWDSINLSLENSMLFY